MGVCFLYGNSGSKRYRVCEVYGGQNPPNTGVKDNDIFLRTNVAIIAGEISTNVGGLPTWDSSDGFFLITLRAGAFDDTKTGMYIVWDTQKFHNVSGFPGSAYVRENGKWRRCDGYVFHSNKWIQFSSQCINLTYFADQCTGVTGGWSNIRWFADSYAAGHVPTVSWNSDGVHIKSDTPPGPGGMVVTKNAVDLTGWSKIVVNCASVSGTEVYCRVSKNTGDSFKTGEVTYICLKAGVNTLDITSLNGVYYIGLVTYHNYNMVVSQVYLE